MLSKALTTSFLLFAAITPQQSLATPSPDDSAAIFPCTASSTAGFYDLRPIIIDREKSKGSDKISSLVAKGHDYNGNFTLNVCAPVVENIENVVGIEESLWRNVSAYYEVGGKVFSIGQQNSNLTVRGRKLVLQYTDGSPCGPGITDPSTLEKRAYENEIYNSPGAQRSADWDDEDEADNRFRYHDDEDEDSNDKNSDASRDKTEMRKSTLISFHCDTTILVPSRASFVGTDAYQCAYFFEIRSPHACPGAPPTDLSPGIGPGGVFVLIVGIAVVVYIVGGVAYNRSVKNQRGLRSLPNYAMWSAIAKFIGDLVRSCFRCVPGKKKYQPTGVISRRYRDDEAGRLIDEYDEDM